MSAKPSSSGHWSGAADRAPARPEFAPSDIEDDDDGFVIDDDDEQQHDAFREQMERVLTQPAAVAVARFRPASAPPVRSKPGATARTGGGEDPSSKARSAAATSLAYLRLAAEKKKARDREFALELRREESEYRKQIAQKIEQANKMVASAGGSKTFAAAPTREGTHMVRVSDSRNGDRTIPVDIFHIPPRMREFEKLASVPLGQAPPVTAANSASRQSAQPARTRRPSSAVARLRGRLQLDADSSSATDRVPVATVKSVDRSLVQEELKSVLASTIALSKALQDQLHELKLKGWNASSRRS